MPQIQVLSPVNREAAAAAPALYAGPRFSLGLRICQVRITVAILVGGGGHFASFLWWE